MFTLQRKMWIAALAGLLTLAVAVVPTQAQFFPRRTSPFFRPYFGSTSAFRQSTLPVYSSGVSPNAPFYNPVMPLYRAGPGTSWQQAMYNAYAPLYAASRLPPWMYGYNPYPPPVIVPNTYATPVVPAYNPYGPYVNYYSGPYGGLVNPYAAAVNPFTTSINPYAAAY